MSTNNFDDEAHFRRISDSVKQQLLDSKEIANKTLELGIQNTKVIELLDTFIAEWIEHCRKNSSEYKNLTSLVCYDAVRRRFLDLREI